MNNNIEDVDNKGYIFANLFDIVLYSILAGLFPLLDLIIALCETSFIGLDDIYELLFAEFFVTASFFYDFYSRYRDCNEQTLYVVNVLYYGRLLFFIATVTLFVLMFLVSKGLMLDDIENALKLIACFELYPLLFATIEANKRMKKEKQRKISKTK